MSNEEKFSKKKKKKSETAEGDIDLAQKYYFR